MTDPTRARDLKLIHAARRQMAWTEDTYRAILKRVTGHGSAADLNAKQRKAVLDDFARLGWNPKTAQAHRNPTRTRRAPDPDRPQPGDAKLRLLGKIEAQLADAGRPWAYADGIARHMFGIDSVRFCDGDQLRRIVAALAYDQQRRARRDDGPTAA